MARRANPTLIGAFVLAVLALAVAGTVYLGAIRTGWDAESYVFFFNESLSGLNVGAPVKYRGIQIGRVDAILLQLPAQKATYRHYIPVVVRLGRREIARLRGVSKEDVARDPRRQAEEAAAEGLRGQLRLESLITGLYYIEVDFVKDAPPFKPIQQTEHAVYPEFPTVPSPFASLGQSAGDTVAEIAAVDFASLGQELLALTRRLNQALQDLDPARLSSSVDRTLTALSARLEDERLDHLQEEAGELLRASHALVAEMQGKVGPLADDLQALTGDMRAGVAELGQVAESLDDLLARDSATRYELEETLRELRRAGRGAAELLEKLQRNPNALVTGTLPPEKGP